MVITMNTRNLAIQAISYLHSLRMNETPDCKRWLAQNEKNYLALKKLNDNGIGATEQELSELAGAPLQDRYAKGAVKKINEIDTKIAALYKKEDELNKDPSLWHGFYSGYEVTPTATCKRKLESLQSRIDKLCVKQGELMKSITIEQAQQFGMMLDSLDDSDFN